MVLAACSSGSDVRPDDLNALPDYTELGTEVRWIPALKEPDQKMNARWRATVGPPVVSISESGVGAANLDSLAVITWNAYVGGGDVIDLVRSLRAGELTGGSNIDHFVLLLQEIHRGGEQVPVDLAGKYIPRRTEKTPPSGVQIDVVEAARALSLNLFYVPSMRNGKPGSGTTEEDRGNAILTTLPMEDFTAIELPFEVHRRVAVAATVRGRSADGASWQLRVCSVHLDHRSRFPVVMRSLGAGRLRQGKALIEALPETPAVIGGDFNTWGTRHMETVLRYVHEAFGQPVRLDDKTTVEARMRPDRQVDYMFFRLPEPCRGRYSRLENRFGSDHHPLLGWVQLACTLE
jgi:endonuclease/exonuclease/phosphatase family metal-dependent hydrolase